MTASNQIIVRKEGALFVLRAFVNGSQRETVQALDAQIIVDYARATWPIGTKVRWIILPQHGGKRRLTAYMRQLATR